jgi:hypothetical protein
MMGPAAEEANGMVAYEAKRGASDEANGGATEEAERMAADEMSSPAA